MKWKHHTGVYQIRNTINGKRYVGSTGRGFACRWRMHKWQLRNGKHGSRHLQSAWAAHGESAFVFEVILICGPDDIIFFEQQCIERFRCADRRWGYNCCPAAGTALGIKRSAETRAKLSAIKLGKKLPPQSAEHRAKIGAAHRGKKLSPEMIEAMRKRATGKRHSAESRAKNSAAHVGLVRPAEHCENIRKAKLGKKHRPKTPEQKAALHEKLSRIHSGRTKTAEHRRKLAEANRGKPFTEERRRNIAAAQRGRKLSPESIAKRTATLRANRLAVAAEKLLGEN